jgi:tRNA-specific 2-thiouridylase
VARPDMEKSEPLAFSGIHMVTPNPDVLCNREIKFDVFLKKALELGADYVATGHYCQKETISKDGKEVHRLIAGEDNNKDQSYFLCQLSQEQLSKAMFPIGHIEKPEVREIARREKLASAEKKDSQGICFVGKVDLPVFLQQKLQAKKGQIIEISAEKAKEIIPQSEALEDISKPYQFSPDMGEVVGTHNGAHFFTVGQRKGLNVGGKAEPLFVIGTDVEKNIVYVGMGHGHPLLMRKALFIPQEEIHFIREDLRPIENCERRYDIRIRYRQPLQGGTIHFKEEGLYIHFDEAQRAIVAGQFAAWYDQGELIGSGVID